jgi:predicted nuclease of predicted toxin-antitoxin system
MKFLLDMGISPKMAAFLNELGHEATHLYHAGLNELPDSDILDKARQEQCILLTHDLDFGELVAASEARLPSVIIFRLRNMHPERVNHYLRGIIVQHQEALAQGAVMSVTEGQVRVRLLPINADDAA